MAALSREFGALRGCAAASRQASSRSQSRQVPCPEARENGRKHPNAFVRLYKRSQNALSQVPLRGYAVATLDSTALQNVLAVCRAHADTKTVSGLSLPIVRLKCTLHSNLLSQAHRALE